MHSKAVIGSWVSHLELYLLLKPIDKRISQEKQSYIYTSIHSLKIENVLITHDHAQNSVTQKWRCLKETNGFLHWWCNLYQFDWSNLENIVDNNFHINNGFPILVHGWHHWFRTSLCIWEARVSHPAAIEVNTIVTVDKSLRTNASCHLRTHIVVHRWQHWQWTLSVKRSTPETHPASFRVKTIVTGVGLRSTLCSWYLRAAHQSTSCTQENNREKSWNNKCDL